MMLGEIKQINANFKKLGNNCSILVVLKQGEIVPHLHLAVLSKQIGS